MRFPNQAGGGPPPASHTAVRTVRYMPVQSHEGRVISLLCLSYFFSVPSFITRILPLLPDTDPKTSSQSFVPGFHHLRCTSIAWQRRNRVCFPLQLGYSGAGLFLIEGHLSMPLIGFSSISPAVLPSTPHCSRSGASEPGKRSTPLHLSSVQRLSFCPWYCSPPWHHRGHLCHQCT